MNVPWVINGDETVKNIKKCKMLKMLKKSVKCVNKCQYRILSNPFCEASITLMPKPEKDNTVLTNIAYACKC